jgi:hypothetical protein
MSHPKGGQKIYLFPELRYSTFLVSLFRFIGNIRYSPSYHLFEYRIRNIECRMQKEIKLHDSNSLLSFRHYFDLSIYERSMAKISQLNLNVKH